MAAEQRIPGRDGTTTIISDGYGITKIVGPPEPPEPTQAERDAAKRADLEGRSLLKKRLSLTDDDIDLAQSKYSFPRSVGRKIPFMKWGLGESQYSRSATDRWRAEYLAFADKVR